MLNDCAIHPRSEVEGIGISAECQPTDGIITSAHAASERYAPNTSTSFAKHALGV